MKMQVKNAVETTVRDIVQRKYNVGDYPRQVVVAGETKELPSMNKDLRQMKQRQKEMDQREAEIDKREAEIYRRELQINSQFEEITRREELIRDQHFEIGQETKKLQILTTKYEEMLDKERQIQ